MLEITHPILTRAAVAELCGIRAETLRKTFERRGLPSATPLHFRAIPRGRLSPLSYSALDALVAATAVGLACHLGLTAEVATSMALGIREPHLQPLLTGTKAPAGMKAVVFAEEPGGKARASRRFKLGLRLEIGVIPPQILSFRVLSLDEFLERGALPYLRAAVHGDEDVA